MKQTPTPSPIRAQPIALMLSILLVVVAHTVVAGDYDLMWHRIAGGGGTASTSGGFELAVTIGQHDAGVMSGGGYSLAGGFWSAMANTAPQSPRPGDLNGDGVVNVSDLLLLLGEWGECVNCGECAADLTGDCSVNVSDLLMLLANWG